ncbi:MAG: 16S rRNA (guanine(966)-N(2))-methyltransferase RsmD [Syntrophales bacterium]
MRIIGGEARGRRIRLPRGCRIRPTADRVKESLFDILHPLDGASFLDMFAGCGNCGLEALSRGAGRAVFLEKEPRLADAIRENLRLLGFEGRAEVIAADAEQGVRRLAKRAERFDVLFADPPYDEGFLPEIMKWLEGADILTDSGLIVLQHSVREALEGSCVQAMAVADQRRYGDTMLSFLKKHAEAENP